MYSIPDVTICLPRAAPHSAARITQRWRHALRSIALFIGCAAFMALIYGMLLFANIMQMEMPL